MKYSKQRNVILEIVSSSYNHPTATDIYKETKKHIPNISLGTVYRNLNQLVEHGYIKKINIPNENERFDKKVEEHSHFICLSCKRVEDIAFSNLKPIFKQIEEENHIQIFSKEIVLKGICHNCK